MACQIWFAFFDAEDQGDDGYDQGMNDFEWCFDVCCYVIVTFFDHFDLPEFYNVNIFCYVLNFYFV